MAIAIKSIPVLTGEAAERFVMEAEANAKRLTPKQLNGGMAFSMFID